MMIDAQVRAAPDAINRINIHEEDERAYWCRKWGVTRSELVQAVHEVGTSLAAVARRLDRD